MGKRKGPKHAYPPAERAARMPDIQRMRMDGDALRQYRLACGLTQRQLAEEIGVGEQSILGWEVRGRTPSHGWEAVRTMLWGHRCKTRHREITPAKWPKELES